MLNIVAYNEIFIAVPCSVHITNNTIELIDNIIGKKYMCLYFVHNRNICFVHLFCLFQTYIKFSSPLLANGMNYIDDLEFLSRRGVILIASCQRI